MCEVANEGKLVSFISSRYRKLSDNVFALCCVSAPEGGGDGSGCVCDDRKEKFCVLRCLLLLLAYRGFFLALTDLLAFASY